MVVRRFDELHFRRYPFHFIDRSIMAASLIDSYEIPPNGEAEIVEMLGGRTVVRIHKGKRTLAEILTDSPVQAKLLATLVTNGLRGLSRFHTLRRIASWFTRDFWNGCRIEMRH